MTSEQPIHSALHDRHVMMGATMVMEGQWETPSHYSTAQQEAEGVLTGAGLCDISPIGKINVAGESLDLLIDRAFSGAKLDTGSVERQVLFGWGAALVDYVVLCRSTADRLLAITAFDKSGTVAEALRPHLPEGLGMVDTTLTMSAIALLGPHAAKVLARLTSRDIWEAGFPDGSTKSAIVASTPVTMLRVDIRRQTCFQLFVDRELAADVWDATMDAGRRDGIVPLGLKTWRELGGRL